MLRVAADYSRLRVFVTKNKYKKAREIKLSRFAAESTRCSTCKVFGHWTNVLRKITDVNVKTQGKLIEFKWYEIVTSNPSDVLNMIGKDIGVAHGDSDNFKSDDVNVRNSKDVNLDNGNENDEEEGDNETTSFMALKSSKDTSKSGVIIEHLMKKHTPYPRLGELKAHCLTLKNTSYPHQRYVVYNTLVNEEEPTGFTSIRRIHQEDTAYSCPNFTKTSMTRRLNTPYLEAFIHRIVRRLMNIMEYYNRGAYAKYPNTRYPTSANTAYRPFSRLYKYKTINSVLGKDLDIGLLVYTEPLSTSEEEKEEEEDIVEIKELGVEYFDKFITRVAYHKYLLHDPSPPFFRRCLIIIGGNPSNLKITCNIGKLEPRIDPMDPRRVSNLMGRIRGMRIFVGNFTYITDFLIVEVISSVIDHCLSQVVLGKPFANMTYDSSLRIVKFINGVDEVAYKMPHKIEQF
nr:MAK10-like protein [Tanacetum cinerariifolium]